MLYAMSKVLYMAVLGERVVLPTDLRAPGR